VSGDLQHGRRPNASGLQAAIVAASGWHTELVVEMVAAARREAAACGVDDVWEAHVAGAGELPLIAHAFARRDDVHALVAVAVIIRGSTAHFEAVLRRATNGLLQVSLGERKPVGQAVVAVDECSQAQARTGSGATAMRAALQQAVVLRAIRVASTSAQLPASVSAPSCAAALMTAATEED
jgi:6,7-dimethyl-8-ribityllumazine synthase